MNEVSESFVHAILFYRLWHPILGRNQGNPQRKTVTTTTRTFLRCASLFHCFTSYREIDSSELTLAPASRRSVAVGLVPSPSRASITTVIPPFKKLLFVTTSSTSPTASSKAAARAQRKRQCRRRGASSISFVLEIQNVHCCYKPKREIPKTELDVREHLEATLSCHRPGPISTAFSIQAQQMHPTASTTSNARMCFLRWLPRVECTTAATALVALTPFVACTWTVKTTGVNVRQAKRPATTNYCVGGAIRDCLVYRDESRSVWHTASQDLCVACTATNAHYFLCTRRGDRGEGGLYETSNRFH